MILYFVIDKYHKDMRNISIFASDYKISWFGLKTYEEKEVETKLALFIL
jgi:hypothetical protein